MGMEHRWGQRTPLTCEVLIGQRSHKLVRGRIRDVSIGGMFVETPKARLAVHSVVDIVFVEHWGRVIRIHRLPAVVVRASTTGVGVMFGQLNPKEYSTLMSFAAAKQITVVKARPRRQEEVATTERLKVLTTYLKSRLAAAPARLTHHNAIKPNDVQTSRGKDPSLEKAASFNTDTQASDNQSTRERGAP